jgi:very-short-patch-repair endonuclease
MPSYHYKNPREHSQYAKTLRKLAPKVERLLWRALSALRIETGLRFRRQHPLRSYIADFACVKARVIVELDGASHDARQEYDVRREAVLNGRGWTILRFSNEEVECNLEGVVLTILEKVHSVYQPTPNPSRKREGD